MLVIMVLNNGKNFTIVWFMKLMNSYVNHGERLKTIDFNENVLTCRWKMNIKIKKKVGAEKSFN